MRKQKRRDQEDDWPTTERSEALPEVVPSPAAAVLRMQALVGNRATTAILARRLAASTLPPFEDREKRQSTPRDSVTIDGVRRECLVLSVDQLDETDTQVTFDGEADVRKIDRALKERRLIRSVRIGTSRGGVTLGSVSVESLERANDEDGYYTAVFRSGTVEWD